MPLFSSFNISALIQTVSKAWPYGTNEENLHTLISTDLEYLNAWSYRWLVKFNPNNTNPNNYTYLENYVFLLLNQ
jgi:hypothetical protein